MVAGVEDHLIEESCRNGVGKRYGWVRHEVAVVACWLGCGCWLGDWRCLRTWAGRAEKGADVRTRESGSRQADDVLGR